MKKIYSLVLFILVLYNTHAQNNIGIGTPNPDPTSILDLSSTSKGFLAPRLSSAQRTGIANPAPGLLVFDTNIGCYFYYNGAWTSLCQLSGPTGATGAIGAAGPTGAVGPTGPGTICGTAASGYVSMFTSPTALCNSVLFQSGSNLGLNTTTPVISFQDNATDGLGLPAGTTTQEPAGAPIGTIRFNTTSGSVEVYNGTCWQNVNTPPIGATYIQWFNAADPNTLYPCTQWVASDLANGEFIRAAGGASNVPAGGALTGALQVQQLLDHTHNDSATIDSAGPFTTSSDGSHNHTGSTGNVNAASGVWIPYDDNLGSDCGTGSFANNNATTCGSGWNGEYTVGNFMGQLNDNCMAHTHSIATDGLHTHIVPAHTHDITVYGGNVNSGSAGPENRPANVAVIFWRRTN